MKQPFPCLQDTLDKTVLGAADSAEPKESVSLMEALLVGLLAEKTQNAARIAPEKYLNTYVYYPEIAILNPSDLQMHESRIL